MDEKELEAFRREWPIRADFYSSVGQGISAWAAMETHLVAITSHLLETSEHKTGLILYSIMNFHTWLNIIDELFSLEPKYQSHRIAWTKASENLKSYNDIRTRLAHHTIWDSKEPELALRPGKFDARIKSKKHKPLTNPEIVEFIGKVSAVKSLLSDLELDLFATRYDLLREPHTVHDKS